MCNIEPSLKRAGKNKNFTLQSSLKKQTISLNNKDLKVGVGKTEKLLFIILSLLRKDNKYKNTTKSPRLSASQSVDY